MDEKYMEMAAENEERQRQQAIADHAGRTTEEQLIVDGVVVCRECDAPIPEQRLAHVPDAVRCIDCQAFHEKQVGMFP